MDFLTRLEGGKQPNDTLSLIGSVKKARARENARIRAEWPQLVPESLKQRLLDNFNFHMSAEQLKIFVCGSCAEACSVKVKSSIPFEDFDFNLLRRQDHVVNSIDADSDVCSGPGESEIEDNTDTPPLDAPPPRP